MRARRLPAPAPARARARTALPVPRALALGLLAPLAAGLATAPAAAQSEEGADRWAFTLANMPARPVLPQRADGNRTILESISEHLGLLAGSLGYGIASGALPFFNAEVYVLGASAIAGRSGIVAIVLGMTVGHMIGKVLLYYAGAGAIRMPLRASYKERLTATRERLERSRLGTIPFIFVSAGTGWPPFYFVAIMAGVLRLGLWTFLLPGTLGRLGRFAVLALFPQLFTGG